MTISDYSRRTGTHLRRLCEGLTATVGVLVIAMPAFGQAQQTAPSGEDLYINRLGCWNCHGLDGTGGAGPSILETRLPLREFVKYVRFPSETMPPVPAIMASDAELTILYHWLDGTEAVAVPPPITLSLSASVEASREGQDIGDREVQVAVRIARARQNGNVLVSDSLGYRMKLAKASAPDANQTIGYRLAPGDEWTTVTTDEHGEAMLALGPAFASLSRVEPSEADGNGTAQFRMALATGRYALVLEVIDGAAPSQPVVVGIGMTIVTVK